MLIRFLFFVIFATSFAAIPARADEYAAPSWADMARTMVRFNALNLADPALIDEYAIVTECDLYKAFYHDDFKWNQVRAAVRQSVQNNIATYPMNYHYDAAMQLDRYDFAARLFRFTDKSAMHNINAFQLYAATGMNCGARDVKFIPRAYRAVLAAPIYLDGLPLAEKDAQMLLKQMSDDNNAARVVMARFNMRVVYIDPLRKTTLKSGSEMITRYEQGNALNMEAMRFDVRLDSVDFYEDQKMTRLIYEYQP